MINDLGNRGRIGKPGKRKELKWQKSPWKKAYP
jgi:hypothetical protein